ncbi:hypothetical protein BTUL_0077g00230 [Botrytis tulipae]|uniref:Uncharacterized protein n=1 Tax=Botrytis tulipae TaxID=87230 RepID=A0A4Z1EN86_9HELO|nr:hypothetical protein BTUL_0077g00230 [Botrytis tulipae]
MQFYDSERYQPSLEDVLTVKNILFTLRPESPLPLELIDAIIDLSEYWPHTTTTGFFFPGQEEGDQNVNISSREVTIRAGGPLENKFLLRTLPIGYLPSQGNNNDSSLEIHSEDQWKFSKQIPKPLPKDREIPEDATEEVLNEWAERSQIRGEHPCKKIVFHLRSHDQGWGGVRTDKGTYRGSYTWFDVGLERTYATRKEHIPESPSFRLSSSDSDTQVSTNGIKCGTQTIFPDVQDNPSYDRENDANPATKYPQMFVHTLNPDNKILQRNKTATRVFEDHKITWRFNDDIHPESPEADELEAQGRGRETANGEFVRNLKIGDVVTLWAKARFPGWANTVQDESSWRFLGPFQGAHTCCFQDVVEEQTEKGGESLPEIVVNVGMR